MCQASLLRQARHILCWCSDHPDHHPHISSTYRCRDSCGRCFITGWRDNHSRPRNRAPEERHRQGSLRPLSPADRPPLHQEQRQGKAHCCPALPEPGAAEGSSGLRRQQSCREPAEQSLPPAAAEAEGRRECSTAGADEAAAERARVDGERDGRATMSAAVCTNISSSSATEDHCSCQESLKTRGK